MICRPRCPADRTGPRCPADRTGPDRQRCQALIERIRREDEYVLFRYKDYDRGGRWRIERVHGLEFIRRFLLHVLPYRFVRIRYCGQLANRFRKNNLVEACAHLGVPVPEPPPKSANGFIISFLKFMYSDG